MASGDGLALGVGAAAVVVRDAHGPAALGRRAGDGDVAAEADEHAAAAGALVRRAAQRSAASAFAVEPRSTSTPGRDARRCARARSMRIVRQPAAGTGSIRCGSVRGDDDVEVAVPAEPAQRAADGGVDVAAGRRARRARRRSAPRAAAGRPLNGRPPARLSARQLGVVAEAAAGEVDRVQLAADGVDAAARARPRR